MTKAWSIYTVFSVLLVGGAYVNYKLNPVPESSTVNVAAGHSVGSAPDFSGITDTQEKKSAFFNYLKPGIEYENSLILQQRGKIEAIRKHISAGKLSQMETQYLEKLAKSYRVKRNSGEEFSAKWVDRLLEKIDVLPVSLVLIQAANESGWGASRFARDGNNYFGQWCYQEGCGLVPLSRTAGMTHEVAKFSSVQQSISNYFLNVNRNNAYKELRKIRAERRRSNLDMLSEDAAIELTNGLLNYSERGQSYIDDLQAMLRNEKV
jgi:Bax protein